MSEAVGGDGRLAERTDGDGAAPPPENPLRLTAAVDNRGILLLVTSARTAAKRAKPLAPQDSKDFWRDALPVAFRHAADAIAAAVASGEMPREGQGVRVVPTKTAIFDEAVARHLKLPELCPHPFLLRCSRRKDGGRLLTFSVRTTEQPSRTGTVDGALIRFRPATVYRAGARVSQMMALAFSFNETATTAQRRIFRRFEEYLDPSLLDILWEGRQVSVFQAGAMGLDAVVSEVEDLRLDPVLFSGMPRGPEDEEPLPLLTDHLQSNFVTAFDAGGSGRRSYRIAADAAVVVDAAVEDCLRVVKSLRRKSFADRLEFLQNPAPRLAKAIGAAGHEPPLIPHGRYAPHVRGIGPWLAPTFPYLSRIETDWLPEQFVVVLNSGAVILSSEQVNDFYQAIEFARKAEQPTVMLLDKTIPIASAMAAWEQIEAQLPQENRERPPRASADPTPVLSLIVADNFDAVSHRARTVPRAAPADVPLIGPHLVTRLKDYQVGGTRWLLDRWTSGAPAALLADDMGIGKTLQTLVFLDWIVRAVVAPSRDADGLYPRPALIVVPSTLVDVWREQVDEHFRGAGLGPFYTPTGGALRTRRNVDISGRLGEFHRQPVTITTYEMMNEHLLVFGAVNWTMVVFDEVQRIKDPATQLRHAATALNTDFVVASTGTPIENRIEDLWSIVDAISPGRLGALREFSAAHARLEIVKLRELSRGLLGPDLTLAPDAPPLMLRRFKEDVLENLVPRHFERHEREMPRAQADAYAVAVRNGKIDSASGVREAALRMVNNVRRISLHPDGLEIVDVRSAASLAQWISRSARISMTFDILDHIRSRGEKVLIYLDDLAVQHVVAQAIRHRFGLAALPQIINGQVTKKRRTDIVAEFQETGDGFLPIILSTRVGGVGLQLTAANHVIHASRWWNPALEDQCNDRVYRLGQTRSVTIHLPMSIYPGSELPSFDRLTDGLLNDKRLLAREVLIPPVTGRESRQIALQLKGMEGLAP